MTETKRESAGPSDISTYPNPAATVIGSDLCRRSPPPLPPGSRPPPGARRSQPPLPPLSLALSLALARSLARSNAQSRQKGDDF
ncbi:hypothetical protein BHM03_00001476 [Ensete ventricosum]|nr:hypothetical protein BHM03_00001476 [Ensete ventricosum]